MPLTASPLSGAGEQALRAGAALLCMLAAGLAGAALLCMLAAGLAGCGPGSHLLAHHPCGPASPPSLWSGPCIVVLTASQGATNHAPEVMHPCNARMHPTRVSCANPVPPRVAFRDYAGGAQLVAKARGLGYNVDIETMFADLTLTGGVVPIPRGPVATANLAISVAQNKNAAAVVAANTARTKAAAAAAAQQAAQQKRQVAATLAANKGTTPAALQQAQQAAAAATTAAQQAQQAASTALAAASAAQKAAAAAAQDARAKTAAAQAWLAQERQRKRQAAAKAAAQADAQRKAEAAAAQRRAAIAAMQQATATVRGERCSMAAWCAQCTVECLPLRLCSFAAGLLHCTCAHAFPPFMHTPQPHLRRRRVRRRHRRPWQRACRRHRRRRPCRRRRPGRL